MKCNLCPRNCNVDRDRELGYCGASNDMVIARYSRHMWEEPVISGDNGSGTIFFSYCNMKCCFRQNYELSELHKGRVVSVKEFSDIVNSWLASQGDDWSWNNYNDDIMWTVIMLTRAYLHVGTARYLNDAKNNFQTVYNRAWTDAYGGGLVWCQGKTSKNACVNGPGAIAACYLAIATGDTSYYTKAQNIISWMNKMLVQSDGGVWDNIDWDPVNSKYTYNTWISTYNQGTYIGATLMLYEYTKNNDYLEMAKRAASRATRISDILDGEDNGGDLIGFKGILARWLGKLIKDMSISTYNVWIQNNAHSAWINRNNENLMWTKFGTKTENNIENSSEDNKRTMTAWGCSAAVSWLVNLAAL